MEATTDMTDNAAAAATIAEQAAVTDLLNETKEPIDTTSSLDIASSLNTIPHNIQATTIMDPQEPQQIDALMTDATDQTTSTPSAQPPTTTTPIPTMIPSRVGTPSFTTQPNGDASSSRADSEKAEQTAALRAAAKNGAPARQWLNEKVTPHMLEILKKVAVEQPENPLRVIAELLNQRASELGQ